MELKLNTYKINEDIEPLLEFDKFNICDLLIKYRAMEHEILQRNAYDAKDITIMLDDILKMINELKGCEMGLDRALKLANECLSKAQSVYQVLLKLKEVIHD